MAIVDDIKEQYPIFTVDFQRRARKRLASQYRESPKFRETIQAYQKQVEDIMAALLELLSERWIDVAVGINLDYLGYWVDQPRITLSGETEPLDDDLYRLFIRTKIETNRNRGTNPNMYYHISIIMGRNDFFIVNGAGNMNIYFTELLTPDEEAYFSYKWTDGRGHEHDFFPIPLGVGRNVYKTDGKPVFGFGPEDFGFGVGYFVQKFA